MTLIKFIDQHRPLLKSHIERILDRASTQAALPFEKDALIKISACVSDGKMLRGILVLISAQIHGKDIDEEIYTIAAVIELLHTTLLIQDDIMDNDFKRRNKDAVFYQYIKHGENKHATDPLLYGQSMAICVADISFFLAFKILSQSIKNAEILRQLIEIITTELQKVAAAQMMDTDHGLTSVEPNEEEIITKYIYKTAHYSFSLPLIVGALYNPAHDNELLKQFGEDVGIIFQLKDDELGIFGNEDEIGKQIGSDIRENKKTLLHFYLLQHTSPDEKEKLMDIYGSHTITTDQIDFIKACIQKYNILSIIQNDIDQRNNNILITLEKLQQKGLDTTLLSDIVNYNTSRNK